MTNSEMLHKVFSLRELNRLDEVLEQVLKENPGGYALASVRAKITQALLDY